MRLSHVLWSLFGLGFPIVVGVITFPLIIHNVGLERFGILSLAWGFIGYAGIFDLGIGRATTQLVSKYVGRCEFGNVLLTLKVARKSSFIVGSAGAFLLGVAICLGGWKIITITEQLNSDVFYSSLIVTLTIPAQCISTMYRGYCEAFLKFKQVNVVRSILGVVNFAGPYFVSVFSNSVPLMVLTLFISRIIAVFTYAQMTKGLGEKLVNSGVEGGVISVDEIKKEIVKFGGWYTISSTISPFLVQMDRFFLGSIISASAVGLYTLPYELVTKTIVLASAISAVALPRYASLIVKNKVEALSEFYKWLKVLIVFMGGGCALLSILLPYVLSLWLGRELGDSSILSGRILCFGIFFNAIGIMFYTYIHACGDTKSTAIIHLFELPLYTALLVFLISKYGVLGAALSWSFRMVVDSSLMAYVMIKRVVYVY